MEPTIDSTIQQVEELYQSLTGHTAPPRNGPHAPIPPEVDAGRYVEEQMQRLMSVVGGPPQPARPTLPAWVPAVTVWENDDEIVIDVDLPGVSRDAVEVDVVKNLLTVSGVRQLPWNDGEPRVHAFERAAGPFQRTIALPARARVDQLTARHRDGVLQIRVARAQEHGAEKRTIPIT